MNKMINYEHDLKMTFVRSALELAFRLNVVGSNDHKYLVWSRMSRTPAKLAYVRQLASVSNEQCNNL